jgi:fatty acid desaturase
MSTIVSPPESQALPKEEVACDGNGAGKVVPQALSLKGPELKLELQRLRQTDNLTNCYYILRTWVLLALAIGGAVAFYQYQASAGISFWWNVPVTILAIVCIGAGQHQLAGAGHEAVHHILFKNRVLNELAADLFCMFPLFSSTYQFRLHHLAHHQFINDPDRDPDQAQLRASGHWLDFPVTKGAFLATLARQLWLPNLLRYILVRARFSSLGEGNPYHRPGERASRLPFVLGAGYLVTLCAVTATLVHRADAWLLAVVPPAMFAVMAVAYAILPARHYATARLHPAVPLRLSAILKVGFLTLLFVSLGWISYLTGTRTGVYFVLLWVTPLLTTFSLFMILRQIVQHGNGDRGFLTNTRVFFVNPLINYAVFPFGMDYHLPHHMFATVPHYRLRELHKTLMRYAEYREQGIVVEGYFMANGHPPENPTVLDVLGPEFAMLSGGEISLDHSVLDDCKVDDRAEIEK